MANGYATGTKINFDINSALDEAEKNGIFTAAEAEKIRKKKFYIIKKESKVATLLIFN